jgi:hypothetical protein
VQQGRHAQRVQGIQAVAGGGAVGAQCHVHAGGQQAPHRAEAAGQLAVGQRVVHHARTAARDAVNVLGGQPDGVVERQPLVQQPGLVQHAHEAAPMLLLRGQGLHPGFQHVHVDRQSVPLRQVRHRPQQRRRAALRAAGTQRQLHARIAAGPHMGEGVLEQAQLVLQ